jgi:tRNA(adenine34) deaminase
MDKMPEKLDEPVTYVLDPLAMLAPALVAAREAMAAGEVPIGAALWGPDGQLLTTARNEVEARQDPLAHAEMLVLRAGLSLVGQKYLTGCILAVTLEPCPLCMAAACHTRVGQVIFGAYDPKSGGTVNGARVAEHMHHRPTVLGGMREEECAVLLRDFFAGLRQ